MSDVFQFPQIDGSRERIKLYRTPFPAMSDADAAKLAGLHGIQAKPRDAGSRLVFQDARSSLEIFRASDSLRWSTLGALKAEINGNGSPPKLPDAATAKKGAAAFLKQRQVPVQGAAVTSVTHGMLAVAKPGEQKAAERPVAVHVNYRFQVDGLPVLGPGAKIQVTFAGAQTPAEMYRFWRAPKADGEAALRRPEAVLDLLRRDPNFAELRQGEAKVVYRNPRLGYYALPPRESQGMLIPVYAFDGTCTTRAFERYDFTRYVVAVEIKPEDAKQAAPELLGTGPIFS